MPIEFIQESQPTGSSSDTLFKLTMAYDGSGRRISKTRWVKKLGSQDWEKELVTHYTGIGTEIRENYAGPAKQTKVVVNMPQGLGRYGIEDAENPDMGSGVGYIPNTKFEWYLKNHLGSTMLVYGTQADANPSHSDIGTPLAAYDYRAFGEMVELTPSPTGKVTENFTGKEHDDEIALDYFGARYLDPMLGMWISVDPKREYFSPYIYLRGNPLNLIDPTGMAEADPEIAKISPKAADYINSFEPKEYELQTFVETYALFEGLTTDFLKNNILKNLTVLYGEYPKPNKKVNGYFDLKDGYAIRMTKKGLDTSPTAGDWQTRIRSTIYHELSHFLNFLWLGKTGTYVYPKYELSDGILTDVYVDPKTHRPTFSDLGKEIEVKLYGKDY